MRIETIKGPRENRFRPAIDPLFRSAALAFGPRVVGVIMSGGLDDGTNGLRSIKMCGGVAVVQDPDDALVRSMPASALTHVSVDHAEPATRIGAVIERLVNEEASPPPQLASLAKKQLEFEVRAVHALAAADDIIQFGEPSLFTCPECHGALLSMQSERPRRYRCHTGHAFTTDSLISELSAATEDAIWNSIRSIQESAILLTHLAEHWRDKDAAVAREFEHQAATARQRAELVRKAADTHPQLSETKVANMARKAT